MRFSRFLPAPCRSLFGGVLLLAAVSAASTASAQGTGYWHTSGDRILDSNNKQVRIAGIDWYGFESTFGVPGGLYAQDYKTVLQTIKAQGFNTVRIPLSSQMIETPGTNLNIAYYNSSGTAINGDLKGLNALEVLDSIVNSAGTIGLKVILDHHRSEAGVSAEANGLWFTPAYPEAAWIADWVALAGRYLGNPTVIGFDLHNEPHSVGTGGACWDCGGTNDWHLAAERAGNAVLAANPDLLVFVEGVDVYNGDYYWWGGNLEGVLKSPVTLANANHLVYSAHDYGPKESAQTWFNAGTSYASLSSVWSKHWAYISQNNIAPVWLGEFGTTNTATDVQGTSAGSQGQWFQSLITFLNADETINWSYWAVNGEDPYALLDARYDGTPVSGTKESMLAELHFPLSTTTTLPAAPANLKATPISSSKVGLAWAMVGGSGVTFAIFLGGSSGDTETLEASGVKATTYEVDNLNAGTNYFFTVKALVNGVASAASNQASAQTPGVAAPAAPGQLAGTAVSASEIDLSWTASATAGVSYTVYSGSSANSLSKVLATGVTATGYKVTGLNAATSYCFMVKAVAQGVTSSGSNIVTAQTPAAVPPAAPSGLAAKAVSATEIDLTWTASQTAGVTYNVYQSTTATGAGTLVASGGNAASVQATGLSAGTAYFFTVKALQGTLSSAASNVATATTAKAATAISCHVSYSVSNDWGTGFTAAIAIVNTGTAAINGWKLTWTYGGTQKVTGAWNGAYTQTGESLTLTNASWNGPIAAGATNTGVGLQGTYTGKNAAPTAFYLNGVACR